MFFDLGDATDLPTLPAEGCEFQATMLDDLIGAKEPAKTNNAEAERRPPP